MAPWAPPGGTDTAFSSPAYTLKAPKEGSFSVGFLSVGCCTLSPPDHLGNPGCRGFLIWGPNEPPDFKFQSLASSEATDPGSDHLHNPSCEHPKGRVLLGLLAYLTP